MQIHNEFESVLPRSVTSSLDKTLLKIRSLRTEQFQDRDLFNASTHLLNKNGKLLRPALLFLGAECFASDHAKYIDLAAAIELLHVSSLVHDDIIDKGVARRGIKSVNAKYGNEVALLSGDALIAMSLSLSSQYGEDIIKHLSDTAMKMCAGETIDYSFQKNAGVPSIKTYIDIAKLKTGSITGVATAAVAIHKNSVYANQLYSYGSMLGVAFQIRDDLFDIIGIEKDNLSLSHGNPNIVKVIMKKNKISKEKAIKMAIEMNHTYIDTALNSLKNRSMFRILEPYAEMVRVGLS